MFLSYLSFGKQTSPSPFLLFPSPKTSLRWRAKSKRYQKRKLPSKKGKACSWNWISKVYILFLFLTLPVESREKLKRKMFRASSHEEKTCEWGMAKGISSGKIHVRLENTLTWSNRNPFLQLKTFLSHPSLQHRWKSRGVKMLPTLIHLWKCWKHSLKISHECLIIRESHPSEFASLLFFVRRAIMKAN